MKKYLKNCIFKGAEILRANNLIKKLKTGATAFCYHGVEYEIIDHQVQEEHLSFNQFENQIDYLRRNFEIISLDYLYDSLKNGYKINSSQVLITFDDGYKNNINVVMPFLRSFNIPFSIFICTNHIDNGLRFPTYYLRAAIFFTEQKHIIIPSIKKHFDISTQKKRIYAKNAIEKLLKTEPQHVVNLIINDLIDLIPYNRWSEINSIFSSEEPMDWYDIKKLNNLGITIGSHCHDHFILHSNQSITQVNYQLKTSKDLIEKNLGKCDYIAFPDGGARNISFDSLLSVKENKYRLGFTIVKGEIDNSSNPYILPRLGISVDISHFKFNINTCFRFNKQLSSWSSRFDRPLTF